VALTILISPLCSRYLSALEFLSVEVHVTGMTSYNQTVFTADGPFAEAERSLAEQRAYVGRLIVCGSPTQAAEDRLKQLERELVRLRAAHHHRNTGG
jgi:hypothetical protein